MGNSSILHAASDADKYLQSSPCSVTPFHINVGVKHHQQSGVIRYHRTVVQVLLIIHAHLGFAMPYGPWTIHLDTVSYKSGCTSLSGGDFRTTYKVSLRPGNSDTYIMGRR